MNDDSELVADSAPTSRVERTTLYAGELASGNLLTGTYHFATAISKAKIGDLPSICR
jgi:hypothetical protein